MLTKEALAFILTGIGATSIDLLLFNSLILKLQVQTFTANLLATSSAMLFSFFANRLVFGYAGELSPLIAGKFLLVTLLSAWIIQTAVIRLLLLHFLSRRSLANHEQFGVRIGSICVDVPTTMIAKLSAIGVALFWNFLWYKYWVFRT